MRSSGRCLRSIASLSAAAFAVHELRYALAFGGASEEAQSAQGHGYLEVICALIGLVVVFAALQFLRAIARPADRSSAAGRGLAGLWAWASATLCVIFAGQELLEGLLAAGHPAGVAGVLGGGGWLAIPLAMLFGLLVALALRETDEILRDKPLRLAAPLWTSGPVAVSRPVSLMRWRSAGVAENLLGRGPPSRRRVI